MIKKRLALCLPLLSMLVLSSCINVTFTRNANASRINGNGINVRQERSLDAHEFSKIRLSGAANIRIHHEETYRVFVTAESNIQRFVTVDVVNNFLDIDLARGNYGRVGDITVDVHMPRLDAISIRGAGNVSIAEGSGHSLDIEITGAGNVSAENFIVNNANIVISGAGNVDVHATDSLTGRASGVWNISYRGGPVTNTLRSRGIGSIRPASR